MRRRQRLGQHYLVDRAVIGRMLEAAAILRGERVVEIGTGRGALTRELVKLTDDLQGYDVDPRNYRELAKELGGDPHLRLHNSDAFECTPEFDVLVSSLPYSESSTFVEWLSRRNYDRAVVLLQEDFARKLVARPGDGAYRAVSVISQLSAKVGLGPRVGRLSFDPPPRVSSCLVTMKHIRTLSGGQVEVVKRLFSQRRRKLGTALKALGFGLTVRELQEVRVSKLRPEEVLAVATRLADLD